MCLERVMPRINRLLGRYCREQPFTIYAAREEEFDSGWVWLSDDNRLYSRAPVVLYCPATKRKTFCEVRLIDENFRKRYSRDGRACITEGNENEALVMSQWYRDALGGLKTSATNCNKKVKIRIRRPFFLLGWRAMRVGVHHPDIAVRVGVRLGVFSAWLAVAGIAGWIADKVHLGWIFGWSPDWSWLFFVEDSARRAFGIFALLTVLVGLPSIFACKGPRHPTKRTRDAAISGVARAPKAAAHSSRSPDNPTSARGTTGGTTLHNGYTC